MLLYEKSKFHYLFHDFINLLPQNTKDKSFKWKVWFYVCCTIIFKSIPCLPLLMYYRQKNTLTLKYTGKSYYTMKEF